MMSAALPRRPFVFRCLDPMRLSPRHDAYCVPCLVRLDTWRGFGFEGLRQRGGESKGPEPRSESDNSGPHALEWHWEIG